MACDTVKEPREPCAADDRLEVRRRLEGERHGIVQESLFLGQVAVVLEGFGRVLRREPGEAVGFRAISTQERHPVVRGARGLPSSPVRDRACSASGIGRCSAVRMKRRTRAAQVAAGDVVGDGVLQDLEGCLGSVGPQGGGPAGMRGGPCLVDRPHGGPQCDSPGQVGKAGIIQSVSTDRAGARVQTIDAVRLGRRQSGLGVELAECRAFPSRGLRRGGPRAPRRPWPRPGWFQGRAHGPRRRGARERARREEFFAKQQKTAWRRRQPRCTQSTL